MANGVVLVSFCNRSDTSGNVLAAVGGDGGVRHWFDLASHQPASACGIAYANGSLFCACSDAQASYLAVFDDRGTLREYVTLPGVSDVHSICTDGSSLFAASTGTDEVVRLPLANLSGTAEVLWRAGAHARDVNHLNSVVLFEGRLLCGGFGPRNGPAWSDAYDGFVYDVSSAGYVARGLYHPHSFVESQGVLYFCESAESSVRTLTQTLRYVDGYSRGLAIRDGTYFIGSSRGRRNRALARYVLNPADAGNRTGRCAISTGTFEDRSAAHVIDLSHCGDEIYDVCFLPEAMYASI